MLTSQDVISAYKLVLGREPESPAIIENYVKHSNFDQLRSILLGSGEFAEKLSRDPRLLAVPMAALSMTDEVRRYRGFLEVLVALALPVWDQSILILGDELANFAGLFLDRQCRVSVAASPHTANLLKTIVSARRPHAANVSFVSRDFSRPVDEDALGRFDFVFGQLPDDSSDVMRVWLDNAAEICTGIMLLACMTAPGRSEDIFVTPSQQTSQQYRTIATKKWIFTRLRERFEHVYEPLQAPSESLFLQSGPAGAAETQAIFVASRTSLSLPSLKEYVVNTPLTQVTGSEGVAVGM